MSTNSADDEGDEAAGQETSSPWADRLQTRIAQLGARKGSTSSGRLETLTAYVFLLRHHYAAAQIERSVPEIVAALLRSIKGGSAAEATQALRALSVTTLTCPSESTYEAAYDALRTACEDADAADEAVKAEALYAMSTAVLYGGGATEAADELLDFLVEIIGSDGQAAGAADSGAVVGAALQAWAFVASHLDDLSAHCEQAMEAFVEQLDSTDADVAVAAGSGIALLFEASRDLVEATGAGLNLPCDPRRLIAQMSTLARGSKSISKRDRRHVRQNFAVRHHQPRAGQGPRVLDRAAARQQPQHGRQQGRERRRRARVGVPRPHTRPGQRHGHRHLVAVDAGEHAQAAPRRRVSRALHREPDRGRDSRRGRRGEDHEPRAGGVHRGQPAEEGPEGLLRFGGRATEGRTMLLSDDGS